MLFPFIILRVRGIFHIGSAMFTATFKPCCKCQNTIIALTQWKERVFYLIVQHQSSNCFGRRKLLQNGIDTVWNKIRWSPNETTQNFGAFWQKSLLPCYHFHLWHIIGVILKRFMSMNQKTSHFSLFKSYGSVTIFMVWHVLPGQNLQ